MRTRRGLPRSSSLALFGSPMAGHVDRQFTLPLGVQVELDADAGTITMVEGAVA